MSLDDDFFVGAMVTKGWWSFLFVVLMLCAIVWQCQRAKQCPENTVYFKEKDLCVKAEALVRPGEK